MPHMPGFRTLGALFHVDSTASMRWIYLVRILSDLVGKGALIFTPVFLYTIGPSLSVPSWFSTLIWSSLSDSQQGLLCLAGFYLVGRTVTLLTAVSAGRVLAKFGVGPTLLLGHLALISMLLALATVTKGGTQFVWVAAVSFGCYSSFFWSGMYAAFTEAADRRHVGRDLGLLQFLIQLGTVVVPALAGKLASEAGYDWLFFVLMVIVAVGGVASLQIERHYLNQHVTLEKIKKVVRSESFKPLGWALLGKYLHDAVLSLWPVYIFVWLGSVERVGFLYSSALLISLLVVFFAGWSVDSNHYHRRFTFSAWLLSAIWVIRFGVGQIWSLLATEVVERITGAFHGVIFDALYIKHVQKHEAPVFFVVREIVISAIALVFWSIVVAITLATDQVWYVLFALAAVGVLVTLNVKAKL